MQLNQDIINHIYSFLPIRNHIFDHHITNIKHELCQTIIFRKWIAIYKNMYSTKTTDYLDRLENDITRWCNNDIPTLFEFTPKLINILNRICPKPFYRFYDNLLTNKKIHTFFSAFTYDELHEVDIYLTSINTHSC